MKIILKIVGVIVIILILGAVINAGKNKNSQAPSGNPSPSQQSSGKSATLEPTKKDLVLRDVKYGPDKRNTMNILVPKGSAYSTPFVLFMHGGAWVSGDKNDVAIVQLALGGAGIASASINYRYASSSVHYKQQMEDVANAVRYVIDHGSEWNIDTMNGIAIGGISAGAHMALLYTYHYDYNGDIDAVISMAGPTDLTNVDFLNGATLLKLIGGANKMVGATYEAGKPVPTQFKDVSPIQYIKNVPTLIIHGTGDVVVPYDQAELLSDALKQKSYTYDLMTINGANHDLGLGNPTTAKTIADKVVAWVKKYNK